MIKNCKVLLDNGVVTVVDFNGSEVQFSPAIRPKSDYVTVKNENGRFTVITEEVKNAVKEIVEVTTDKQVEEVQEIKEPVKQTDTEQKKTKKKGKKTTN